MTLKSTLGAWLCAAATLMASTMVASAADKVVLLLNWYNYGEHAPFYLGIDKGLFAKEGIELEIQEGRGSGVTVQATAAGSATFGYADFGTMVKAAVKGAPIKAVGIMLQKSPMAVQGFADKNVRTPKDMIGKTVIFTPGDSFSQLWPALLKVNGIEEKQVKVISGDAATKRNAVISGQADFLLGNVNDQKPLIEEATGKPVYAMLFADWGVNTVNGALIAKPDLLASNPDLVKRFLRAVRAAVEDAKANPAGAVDAMLKVNPKAGKRETLLASWTVTLPLLHTARTADKPALWTDPQDITSTLDILAKYSGVEVNPEQGDKFYTNDFQSK
ncbi:ABC transporter substrate-binding protein [Aquabacter spiritensis]|uniref:NitT/TauT family transport system substrate-binding protein n=1 Tax=Aquabacter spiritensis TaxID=933073 RepID=A0A4R3LZH1_9HYPH|nr:ABC transporter substrate-binding protein [Aquabacter spiritensis]TCT05706.1 NitT/TauT family transport system substrate-binding protein [Aquabacter spiritensis]